MTVYGAVQHPQGVFIGYREGDPRLSAMASMVAGHLVEADGQLRGRRPLDYDIVVQRGEDGVSAASHLSLLSFGCKRVGRLLSLQVDGDTRPHEYAKEQPSPTMTVNTDLPDRLRRLVEDELVPWLSAQPTRPVLCYRAGMSTDTGAAWALSATTGLHSEAIPFVLDADQNVIAGAFRRGSNSAWAWILPHDPEHPELWLSQFLRDLHTKNPQRFPEATPWRSRPEWMSRDELAAQGALDLLEHRKEAWDRAYRAHKSTQQARLLEASAAADAGLRRLLTEQGNALVDAVADALAQLGYQVSDEDAHRAETGRAKAHDLNIIDPDRPEAVVIAEVKGTTRAALNQAHQHINRYTVSNAGRAPDQCWLIINHFADRAPEERPVLLLSNDEDIAVFGESDGVLVDTRDLFRLVKRVADGDLTAAEGRALFAMSSGRFVLRTSISPEPE